MLLFKLAHLFAMTQNKFLKKLDFKFILEINFKMVVN